MLRFGFTSTQLTHVTQHLETLFNVHFELHESDWRGGDYYRAELPYGEILVQNNYDLMDKEPFEEDWPEKRVIVYLDGGDDKDWSVLVEKLCSAGETLGVVFLEKKS
jgi:hypothetical protein